MSDLEKNNSESCFEYGESISYQLMLKMFRETFATARNDLNFTSKQAFAYAYDDMGIYLLGENPWNQFAAYTAYFICAFESNVILNFDSLFDIEVMGELRDIYKAMYSEVEAMILDVNSIDIKKDMITVNLKYVNL